MLPWAMAVYAASRPISTSTVTGCAVGLEKVKSRLAVPSRATAPVPISRYGPSSVTELPPSTV